MRSGPQMSSRSVRFAIAALMVAVVGLTAGVSRQVVDASDGPVAHRSGLWPQQTEGLLYSPGDPYVAPEATPGGWVAPEVTDDVRWPHPIATAQAGLNTLASGDVDAARGFAHGLVNLALDDDGKWWLPYWFDWHVRPAAMDAPWVSAMAQGQALSLFASLYAETGEAEWFEAAERMWETLQVRRDDGGRWWSQRVVDGYLWFDEYPDGSTHMVVNGHVFALYGVYDWWRVTGDEDAAALFDEAATTALRAFGEVRRPGEASVYCVNGCGWSDDYYHRVHVGQLENLVVITGDPRFADMAEQYRDDHPTQ
jgi:hypothetical protein